MITISSAELRNNMKKYLDLAKKEKVTITQRGSNDVFELVKKRKIEERYFTSDEFTEAILAEIDTFPDKK